VRKDHFHGRKSNFSITALKKSSNPGEINESLCKLRGLVTVRKITKMRKLTQVNAPRPGECLNIHAHHPASA